MGGAPATKPAMNMKMAMVATVLTVLAIVLIIVAMVTPWYTLSITGGGSTGSGSYSFSGVTSSFGNQSQTRTWSNVTEEYKSMHNGTAPATPGVYSTTMYLLVGGLVFAILGILTGWMAGQGKLKAMVPMIVALLAFVLTIAAFGYFASSHVAALSHDGGTGTSGDGPDKSFIASLATTTGYKC